MKREGDAYEVWYKEIGKSEELRVKEEGVKECSLDDIRYKEEDGAGQLSERRRAVIELVTAVILKQSDHLQADMLDLVKRRQKRIVRNLSSSS
ncbi:hypothetical protein KY305_03565 [Bacillus sp. YC2]|uniref:hypothetical protein n=1 Tax=Bacillus sp. YC2 TaxID=2861287 RepID=UPI001CA6B6F1|nr:hypothetical protein [Bacillus sp. YC2]MBY8911839.1 hypothetical protein [Bacillus sp. YC2]